MAICSECGMHFHNKSNLNRHMKAMHAQAAQDEESEDDVEDDADVVECSTKHFISFKGFEYTAIVIVSLVRNDFPNIHLFLDLLTTRVLSDRD